MPLWLIECFQLNLANPAIESKGVICIQRYLDSHTVSCRAKFIVFHVRGEKRMRVGSAERREGAGVGWGGGTVGREHTAKDLLFRELRGGQYSVLNRT